MNFWRVGISAIEYLPKGGVMQTRLIEISKEDQLVAQLNKDLLAVQQLRHYAKGASLFRPLGELFNPQPADTQVSLFDKK